jgi:lipoprotein-anchoring transpeptidase ErfK/SrfK
VRGTGRIGHSTRPSRAMLLSACCAVAGLLAAGCSAATPSSSHGARHARKGSVAAAHSGIQIAISPATGSKDVNPSDGISITAAHGTLTSVSVQSGGDAVPGAMNSTSTAWHTTWTLGVASTYTVTATGRDNGGQPVTQTSTFTTLNPANTFTAQIYEAQGATYGVGMPIILKFSQPITDKAAVERALQLQTSRPVIGSWYWDGDQTADFRPESYWPADTTVSFTGHLDGVEGAPGMFGFHTLTQSFRIGESLIVVASTTSHHMELYRDGRLLARWPISTGRPTLPTPNGTYVTIDKGNPVLMVGPGYREDVPWSVRFTFSGDYLHDAYWSVAEQGTLNVSHGCVNMPPADAEEYYKMEVPGDPVTITGSPRSGTWDDGWTEWFLTWPQYLKGSALGEAVEAGTQGSTFVSPSSVPTATTAVPLGTSRAGNWHAA